MARGEISTDMLHPISKGVQPAHGVGQHNVDPRVSGQHVSSWKRNLEERGMAPQPKRIEGTRELSSQRTLQASQKRRQGASSQHQLRTAAAQADQMPLKRERGRQRARGHGRGTTQRTQRIQSGMLEFSSPLARQSGRGRPTQPTIPLANPDALPALTDAEVARSWQRRMSGYFEPPANL